MIPVYFAANEAWLFTVPGSHETLVGSRDRDGKTVYTFPFPPSDLLGLFTFEHSTLQYVGNVSNAVAQTLLGSPEWGNIEFDYTQEVIDHIDFPVYPDGVEVTEFNSLINSMELARDVGLLHLDLYNGMQLFAFTPFGFGTYDLVYHLLGRDHELLAITLLPVLHGRLCFVAPNRHTPGFPFLLWDQVYWLENELFPITTQDNLAWRRLRSFTNSPPSADAGPDISVSAADLSSTVILGTATDPDSDILYYTWREEATDLTISQLVHGGLAYLDFSALSSLSIGTHTLTLEVEEAGVANALDNPLSASDTMLLTVTNSPPNVVATGGGTYEIWTPVVLGGFVSDHEGDLLNYEWSEGDTSLFNGQIQTILGGDPVDLPDHIKSDFELGTHILSLSVNDGINPPVSSEITVEVVDTTPPTLDPVSSTTVLWPPSHKLVPVTIEVNSADNSGGPISLTVSIESGESSGEPDSVVVRIVDGPGGSIDLLLRSARKGKGDGRTYTITILAEDPSGNTNSAQIQILAPHDRRKS